MKVLDNFLRLGELIEWLEMYHGYTHIHLIHRLKQELRDDRNIWIWVCETGHDEKEKGNEKESLVITIPRSRSGVISSEILTLTVDKPGELNNEINDIL